jgi:hypothetical protein
LYKKINSSSCRVLALSGTPIYNESYEWSILGNLLKPGTFPNILVGDQLLISLWNPKAVTDVQLQGIVSYYPGDPSMYPEVRMHEPIAVYMTEKQYIDYQKSNRFETMNCMMPSIGLKYSNPVEYARKHADFMLSSKRIPSRRSSNFYYPPEAYQTNLPNQITLENITDETQVPDVYKIPYPDLLKKDGGWITDEMFRDGKIMEWSPKFVALLLNIGINRNTKHMVYTFFKERAGVVLLHTILTHCGIKSEIFSGDLNDSSRTKLLDRFNHVNNRDGQHITVILVTEAGAEGITLLETNNVHILESSTRESKTRQAIGRVIRYKSHVNMPKDRQYVNVYRYWSLAGTSQDAPALNNTMCVDEKLYLRGIESGDNIELFTDRLIKNSIENVVVLD